MEGLYKEKLPIGFGELVVTKNDFHIEIELRIPDLRYKVRVLTIERSSIDDYIEAYKLNWNKYIELKEENPSEDEEVSITGLIDMQISTGCFMNEGVSIYAGFHVLNSEEKINEMINSLQWAKEKGIKIMEIMK